MISTGARRLGWQRFPLREIDRGIPMKKLALQVAALSLALAGTASAADMRLPTKAPAPAPVVMAYNWTGCYVGAGGGYGMFVQKSRLVDEAVLSNDNGGRGWFGTVQVGCDYQIGSNIVIGAFGDYDFSGIKGDMSLPTLGWVGEEKLKNSWAAGGRIGWVPWTTTQFMWFISGGYTQARFGQVDFFRASDGLSASFNLVKHTYSGWFIGSGYEYGIGWLPGLFWKTEYRFADYGNENVDIFRSNLTPEFRLEAHKYVHTVRSELVWRFNFGGPVVARY
jgi:outer membrane immunogenic protein